MSHDYSIVHHVCIDRGSRACIESKMPSPASPGPTTLLASGRLGRQIGENRSDQPIFVDSCGHLCCMHGERASTIMSWVTAERENAENALVRPSRCSCENIDGLLSAYSIAEEQWPKKGGSLYKLLGFLGTEEANVNTRPQRYALTTHAGVQIWVQPAGTLVCKHGNTKKTLIKVATKGDACKFRSSRIIKCACALSIPRRVGSVFVKQPLGVEK